MCGDVLTGLPNSTLRGMSGGCSAPAGDDDSTAAQRTGANQMERNMGPPEWECFRLAATRERSVSRAPLSMRTRFLLTPSPPCGGGWGHCFAPLAATITSRPIWTRSVRHDFAVATV